MSAGSDYDYARKRAAETLASADAASSPALAEVYLSFHRLYNAMAEKLKADIDAERQQAPSDDPFPQSVSGGGVPPKPGV